MIFYVFVGLVAVTIAVGYGQVDTLPAAASLGMTTYIYATRQMSIRVNAAFSAIILCLAGIVMSLLAAVWFLSDLHYAGIAAVGTLAILCWVAKDTVPLGIRLMRVIFSGQKWR